MSASASAPGKIILSGELAVLFGYPGIAIPAPLTITATFEPDEHTDGFAVFWDEVADKPEWQKYLKDILMLCKEHTGTLRGCLKIVNQIPLGKGMGSSTALVIAVSKCLLAAAETPASQLRSVALAIEDEVNPGHSGIDFHVIWDEKPILFKKGQTIEHIDLPSDLLKGAILIDTGTPNETTTEIIKYVTDLRSRDSVIPAALETIGKCTERIQNGDDLAAVLQDHHKAQVNLGVVPPETKSMITKIEQEGGAAKVLGAGALTGGGGMVLAINTSKDMIEPGFPVIQLI